MMPFAPMRCCSTPSVSNVNRSHARCFCGVELGTRKRKGFVTAFSRAWQRLAARDDRSLLRRGYLSVLLANVRRVPAWPQQNLRTLPGTVLKTLMSIEVTSVSKKGEKLARTAAAIFVITAEDIRRSGATNIPDLLRMVPGLDVAQINGSTWAGQFLAV